MTDLTYNGYTNFATWCMSMHLDGNYNERTYHEYYSHLEKLITFEELPDTDSLIAFVSSHFNFDFYDYQNQIDDIEYLGNKGERFDDIDWQQLVEQSIGEMREMFRYDDSYDVVPMWWWAAVSQLGDET